MSPVGGLIHGGTPISIVGGVFKVDPNQLSSFCKFDDLIVETKHFDKPYIKCTSPNASGLDWETRPRFTFFYYYYISGLDWETRPRLLIDMKTPSQHTFRNSTLVVASC